MKKTNQLLLILGTALLTCAAYAGPASVEVSTGYFDLAPGNGGSGLPLPNPWAGSANTVFFGNVAQALGGDPDENGILLQNLGSTSVTLSAANFGGGTLDLFSADLIAGPIGLVPNVNYILAGNDGSDIGFGDTVGLTIDGQSVTYNDASLPGFPDGVLHGFGSSADETAPWTPIFVPQTSNVPDSSSTLLLGALGFCALAAYHGHARRQKAAV